MSLPNQRKCSLSISPRPGYPFWWTKELNDLFEESKKIVIQEINAVDHKPLLKILGDRCLEDIPNPRLRSLKEKSLRYRFRLVHVPGHRAADGVSRQPVSEPKGVHLPDDVATFSHDVPYLASSPLECIRAHMPPHDPCLYRGDKCDIAAAMTTELDTLKSITWDDACLATARDETMSMFLSLIEDGLQRYHYKMPLELREYFSHDCLKRLFI